MTRIIGRYDAIKAKTENLRVGSAEGSGQHTGGEFEAKAYQKLPMLAGLSLVRSGCWLIAPEMARKSPGHAKNLYNDGSTC